MCRTGLCGSFAQKLRIACVALLAVTMACGSPTPIVAPGGAGSSPRQELPIPTPSDRPAQTAGWPVYTDVDFGLTISYPPGFAFQKQHAIPGTGLLMAYRVVETQYVNGYPPGQIEIHVHTRDSSDLSSWITAHTGPPTPSSPNNYWEGTSNLTTGSAGAHKIVSFDAAVTGFQYPIHGRAVFLGTAYVLVIDHWANQSMYRDVLGSDAQKSMESLKP